MNPWVIINTHSRSKLFLCLQNIFYFLLNKVIFLTHFEEDLHNTYFWNAGTCWLIFTSKSCRSSHDGSLKESADQTPKYNPDVPVTPTVSQSRKGRGKRRNKKTITTPKLSDVARSSSPNITDQVEVPNLHMCDCGLFHEDIVAVTSSHNWHTNKCVSLSAESPSCTMYSYF